MQITIEGSLSFSHIHADLNPGEAMTAESGAMQSMAAEMEMKAGMNGNFFSALAKKFFGGESFFVSRYSNPGDRALRVTLAQDLPGEIREYPMREGDEIHLQRGAYLAHSGDLRLSASWGTKPVPPPDALMDTLAARMVNWPPILP